MNTPSVPPVIDEGHQKLVTVYLDNSAYAKGKMLVGSYSDKHGLIEEHLDQYLGEGWKVSQIQGFGGVNDGLALRGWMAVLLERS